MKPSFRPLTSLLLMVLLLSSGAPLLAAAPPRSSVAAPLDVVINEVAWMGTLYDANDEWMELYNNTASPIDLTGWTLQAADGTPNIALAGTIPAHGYFLLERTDDTTIPDIPADQTYTGAMANTGEVLELRDSGNNLVDTANGDGGGWPAGDNTTKQTMERIDPTAPDSDANWGSNTTWIRNGHDNGGNPLNATPKARNSLSWPDLTLAKQAPASAPVGSPLSYHLAITNSGPLAAPAVLITDTLPAGFVYASYDGPYTCALAGSYTFSCQAGSIAPYEGGAITITGSVALTASGTLLNQVWATTAITEVTGTNNLAQASTVVQQTYPDLAVTKSGPTTAHAGDPITYTLRVENIGLLLAPAVRVTDTLPAEVNYLSYEGPYTCTPAAPYLTCEVGDLAAGDGGTLLLHGQVVSPAGGPLVNTWTATTPFTETTLDNNTAVWTTTLSLPGEGAVVINEVAWAGTSSAYTADEWMELYNAGSSAVDLTGWTLTSSDGTPSITLTGVITAGGYFLLEAGDDNTVSDIPADQIYSGNLANAGEVLTLRDAGGNVVDTANGDGGGWPAGTASPNYQSMERVNPLLPDTESNWADNDMIHRNGHNAGGGPINGTPKALNSASYPPPPAPDLDVSKTGPITATPGALLTYTMAVSNVGTAVAPDVRLTDTLPAGVAYVLANPLPDDQPSPGTLVWVLASLPTATVVPITLVGQVGEAAGGALVNTLAATTPVTETALENNTATWTTTVSLPGEGAVVINEVAWGGTLASASDEWMELYNAADHPVDLTGWTLTSSDGTPAISLTGVLPAGGYFLLEAGDDNTVSDIPADQIYSGNLANAGEVLTLRDAGGNVVDTANGDGGGWPAGVGSPTYQSMERINPLAPDADTNWADNDMVHRNGHDAANNEINGTPKHLNSTRMFPDLEVGKTGPLTTTPGATMDYLLVIANIGGVAAPDLRITDTLPAEVAFLSQAASYPFTFDRPAPNTLVWTAGSLPTGTQALITVSVQVNGTAAYTLTNAVRATTTLTEINPANNAASWDTGVETTASRVNLPLVFKNYRSLLRIDAVLYDGYQDNDADEAVCLANLGTVALDLAGWELCKDTSGGLSCRALPAAVVPPMSRFWLARHAVSFTLSFGFPPDYEMSSWPILANDGDEVILRCPSGATADAVVFEGGNIYISGWSGEAVYPYAGSGNFGSEGQILARSRDEATGWPLADTDTAADWIQYPYDDYHGRHILYPGWDLEAFSRPLSATEMASLTVAIAPDNATAVFLAAIGRAQSSIEAEFYDLKHYTITNALAAKAAQGVKVTILLEGEPAGGLTDQEKWACQQIAAAGGQCYFMFNEHDDPGEYVFDRYTNLHSKFVLVDRQWVIISSQNPTHSGLPGDNLSDGTWGSRGVLILTDAPSVVARVAAIWDADLDPVHHTDLTLWAVDNPYGYGPPSPGFIPDTTSGGFTYTVQFPTPLVTSGPIGFEVLSAPESALRTSDSLLGLLAQAGPGDTVDVQQMYEYADWGTLPDDTAAPNLRLAAYIAAARRGARVRVLLNSGAFGQEYSDIARNADTLAYLSDIAYCEGLNLQVRLGNPTDYGIHNKMVLVNRNGVGYSHVGSINGSETSSKANREVAVQIRSNEVYGYLAEMFQADWERSGHLLVAEVQYNPDGDDTGKEWVEIYNPTDQMVDLSGWMLGDAVNVGEYGSGRYSFPAGTVIPPYSLLTVASLAQFVAFEPDLEFLTDPNFDHPAVPNMVPVASWEGFGFALANEGDEVILQNPAGEAVDVLVYGTGAYPGVHPYVGDTAAGHSLERRPPERDTEYCSADFFDTNPPTPGDWPAGYHECE